MAKETAKKKMPMAKEEWASKLGVILAVSGSAVGLGNFLRFPGQAVSNGGGAFMIPYFCALLLLGIPIGWAEWTMGRYGGRKGFHSSPSILGVFGRGSVARYLGVIGILIPLAVSFYYTYIEAWCLGYFFHYLRGGIGIDAAAPVAEQTARAAEFYQAFTGAHHNGVIAGGSIGTFVFWTVTFAINIWLVFRGITRGIEKFVNWAMPTMALLAIVVLIRVLTLGSPDPANPDQNVVNGLGYMWNPNFSALTNPQTWLAAAGQIFFSLSVGFGVIINYASYMKKKSDVVLSGLTASATNELFEVGFGGLITITASFIFVGTSNMIGAVQGGTFGLGFTTLPVVFSHMGSAGTVIGAIWFFMLFLAAITSSISMYQPTLAFFQEALGWPRRKATGLLVTICCVGSFLVMYFSQGGVFWSTIDNWVGTFLIFVLAMVQIIVFSWVFGVEKGVAVAHHGACFHIPKFYRFIMKYVTPTYLLLVFAAFCWQNLGSWVAAVVNDPLQQGAIGLIVAVAIVLVVCTRIGEKRWRAAGLDIDGREPPQD
jgi:SNF family Na+-dependent transporter